MLAQRASDDGAAFSRPRPARAARVRATLGSSKTEGSSPPPPYDSSGSDGDDVNDALGPNIVHNVSTDSPVDFASGDHAHEAQSASRSHTYLSALDERADRLSVAQADYPPERDAGRIHALPPLTTLGLATSISRPRTPSPSPRVQSLRDAQALSYLHTVLHPPLTPQRVARLTDMNSELQERIDLLSEQMNEEAALASAQVRKLERELAQVRGELVYTRERNEELERRREREEEEELEMARELRRERMSMLRAARLRRLTHGVGLGSNAGMGLSGSVGSVSDNAMDFAPKSTPSILLRMSRGDEDVERPSLDDHRFDSMTSAASTSPATVLLGISTLSAAPALSRTTAQEQTILESTLSPAPAFSASPTAVDESSQLQERPITEIEREVLRMRRSARPLSAVPTLAPASAPLPPSANASADIFNTTSIDSSPTSSTLLHSSQSFAFSTDLNEPSTALTSAASSYFVPCSYPDANRSVASITSTPKSSSIHLGMSRPEPQRHNSSPLPPPPVPSLGPAASIRSKNTATPARRSSTSVVQRLAFGNRSMISGSGSGKSKGKRRAPITGVTFKPRQAYKDDREQWEREELGLGSEQETSIEPEGEGTESTRALGIGSTRLLRTPSDVSLASSASSVNNLRRPHARGVHNPFAIPRSNQSTPIGSPALNAQGRKSLGAELGFEDAGTGTGAGAIGMGERTISLSRLRALDLDLEWEDLDPARTPSVRGRTLPASPAPRLATPALDLDVRPETAPHFIMSPSPSHLDLGVSVSTTTPTSALAALAPESDAMLALSAALDPMRHGEPRGLDEHIIPLGSLRTAPVETFYLLDKAVTARPNAVIDVSETAQASGSPSLSYYSTMHRVGGEKQEMKGIGAKPHGAGSTAGGGGGLGLGLFSRPEFPHLPTLRIREDTWSLYPDEDEDLENEERDEDEERARERQRERWLDGREGAGVHAASYSVPTTGRREDALGRLNRTHRSRISTGNGAAPGGRVGSSGHPRYRAGDERSLNEESILASIATRLGFTPAIHVRHPSSPLRTPLPSHRDMGNDSGEETEVEVDRSTPLAGATSEDRDGDEASFSESDEYDEEEHQHSTSGATAPYRCGQPASSLLRRRRHSTSSDSEYHSVDRYSTKPLARKLQRTSMQTVVQAWMTVQFAALIVVFVYFAAKRGPSAMLSGSGGVSGSRAGGGASAVGRAARSSRGAGMVVSRHGGRR